MSGEDRKSRARPPARRTRQLGSFAVRGTVRNPDGSPIARARIAAVDMGLRGRETPLGEATTAADGSYNISYAQEQLQPVGKAAADLIVRAYDRAGNDLARSELLCRAPAEAVVDLVVGNHPFRGPSEYDALVGTIRPYLGETPIAELQRDDVQFLACSAAVDRRQLATLIVANQLARESSLPDWLFYALGRQGVRLQLAAIVLLRRESWKECLRVALDANIVPPAADDVVDRLLEQLQAALVRTAFDGRQDGGRFSFGALLGTSLAGREEQEAFLAAYLARPASSAEFWDHVERDARITPGALDDLRLTLLLGKLAQYRVPVLAQLKRLRQDGEVRSLRDLSRVSRARWREIVRAAASDPGFELPVDIPGETPNDRLEHYVTSLRAPIESLFPSDSLRRKLESAPETDADLRRFLANAPDLDLYWTNVDAYLTDHRDEALSGIVETARETVIERAKRVQRLLRLTRRADQVRVLDAAGFDSAVAIARTSKARFRDRFVAAVEQLHDTLEDAYVVTGRSLDASGAESAVTLVMMNSAAPPDKVADAVHDSAVAAAGFYLEEYVGLQAGLQLWPDAIGGPRHLQRQMKEAAFKAVPDLETLFGSQSFCACEHCRSVYGPAAYLVDLLHELDSLDRQQGKLVYADAASVPGPIGPLLRRRPDIARIPLTCENTNTTLPYIDLVNEALESYIESHLDSAGEWTNVVPAGTPTIQEHDTGKADPNELRAVPQYLIPEVYDHLARQAVYPMTLPFHRWLETVRVYLGHLGTSRFAIMEAFRSSSASAIAPIVERLAMCPAQYRIVAATTSTDPVFSTTDSPKPVWNYFGYGSAGDLSALIGVPAVLERTGISLDDLIAMLKTQFLNPALYAGGPPKTVTIEFPSSLADDACDVSKMKMANLDPVNDAPFAHGWLDRLHRFVRLWRALGWSIDDVDRALATLGGALDDQRLEKLAAMKEVAVLLDRPVASLLVLWGQLDAWGEIETAASTTELTHRNGSSYAQTFLSRLVLQDEQARQVFEDVLLSKPSGTLASQAPAISAALAITADDIERIRDHAGLAAPDKAIDLSALSTLCRYATLAKALDIRVRDLITLLRLVPPSVNPFTPADPRPALEFIQTTRNIQASGFPTPLVNYLFRDQAEPTRHPAPTRAMVKTTLQTVQSGLAAIHQEMHVAEQPPADTLRARLELAATLLNLDVPKGVEQALAVLDPRQVSSQGQTLTLQYRKQFADDHVGGFLSNPAGTLFGAPLPDPANLVEGEQRFLENVQKVLDALTPWLRRRLQTTFVVGTVADAVGVDRTIVQPLLETHLVSTDPQHPGSALECFFSLVDEQGAPVDLKLAAASPGTATRMVSRVFKAAAYVNGIGMTEAELALFAGSSSPLRALGPSAPTPLVLDLNALPIDGVVPGSSGLPGQLFEIWRALQAFYELRQALPRSEKTLVDYFNAPDAATKRSTLVEAAGWDADQINAVVQGFDGSGSPGAAPDPPATVPGLVRLHGAMTLLKRVGATPERMFAWAGKTPDRAQADEVVETVKARYERARWLEVARSLNDPLREKHRDALVALLLVRLTPAIPIAEWPHPVLKLGATGAAVNELQQKLNASQTSAALAIDGTFGPKTRTAVIQFQKTYSLAPDGVVGPSTWAVLDRPLAGPLTGNDLLEYFLIDTAMSSCMLTSRIKQAISSVQLFVQRCLLNLEPAVSPDAIDADRWQWMKQYRIWEANRKVFLYPETYVLPELRDDKTPFFKELERDLLQNELTGDAIETALATYVYKLDEIARLDIRAFCKEEDEGDEIYHVFGRTWNPPYVYYYRRGTFAAGTGTSEWSAWERLELDIQGDYLMPIVNNRKLWLFWPLFEEKAGSGDTPALALKMAWSWRKDDSWTRKQTSKAYLYLGSNKPEHYPLFLRLEAERIVIFVGLRYGSDADLVMDDSDQITRNGIFTLDVCGNEMQVQGPYAFDNWSLYMIAKSAGREMMWLSDATTLGFPAIHKDPVLSKVSPKFRIVPPPTLDQASSQKWFSFWFEDGKATYVARPVAETAGPLATGVIAAPSGAGDPIKKPDLAVFPHVQDLLGPDPSDVLSAVIVTAHT